MTWAVNHLSFCTSNQRMENYARKWMELWCSCEGTLHDRREGVPSRLYCFQSFPQSSKHILFFIMLAEAYARAPGMMPDLCRKEQKAQASRRQGGVAQRLRRLRCLPVEGHQPCVEIVGQHVQLEVVLVGYEQARGIWIEPKQR